MSDPPYHYTFGPESASEPPPGRTWLHPIITSNLDNNGIPGPNSIIPTVDSTMPPDIIPRNPPTVIPSHTTIMPAQIYSPLPHQPIPPWGNDLALFAPPPLRYHPFAPPAVRRRHSQDSDFVVRSGKRSNPHMRGNSTSTMPRSPERKGKAPAQPLRRGDACLMCRAKKLKCSATKPSCDQCTKRKDRCVYDAVRPASRVEKLEKKLAEMEEAELHAVLAARRHSGTDVGMSTTPSLNSVGWPNNSLTPLQTPNQMGGYNDYSRLFSSFSGPVNSVTPPSTDSGASPYTGLPTNGDARNPAMAVDGLNAWSWPNSSNTRAQTQPQMYDSTAPTLEGMPWSLLSSSNDVSTVWSMDMGNQSTTVPTMNGTDTMDTYQSLGLGFELDPSVGFHLTQSLKNVDNHARQTVPEQTPFKAPSPLLNRTAASTPRPDVKTQLSAAEDPERANKAVDEVLAQATEQKTTLTEDDISQSARDYLLDLFFCPPRVAFGSEVWSEEQFRAKMALPPNSRPHPCLVFSMYTLAASSSYIPAVRALADSLYSIALVKLDEAIAAQDRLLDAINAAKGLGKWQFSRARPLEGFALSNRATMLAQTCNLHRIKSGVFRADEQTGPQAEAQWPLLGPPKDQWELGERIHAFWSAYASDRGAACMTSYPNLIDDTMITTPLPRPPEEYLNGTVARSPEFRLRDIYLLSTRDDLTPPSYMYGTTICALHLCYRAKLLLSQPPESITTYTALALSSETLSRTQGYCARRDHPAAYKEIMEATYAIERKMSDEYKIRDGVEMVWETSDGPLTHSCILCARMLLHSLDADSFDRDSCIQHARDFSTLVRSWAKTLQVDKSDATSSWTDDKVADSNSIANVTTRTKNGIGGPYILTGWFWAADRLVRGASILRSLGRHDDAKAVSEDATTVVNALKSIGVLYQQTHEATGSTEVNGVQQ